MIKPLSYFQTIISSSALKPKLGGQGSVRSVKLSNKQFIFPQETLCLFFLKGTFVFMFVVLFFKICVLLYLMSAEETYHFLS